MAPSASFGDVVLRGDTTYRWDMVSGVFPHVARWVVTRATAEDIEAQGLGKPFVFVVASSRTRVLRVERLYVTQIDPATSPLFRVLVVQDLRWRWSYPWISSGFNMVRMSGELIPADDASGNPIARETDPALFYNPATLFPKAIGAAFGNTPWTARQVLEHVLTAPEPDGLGETLIVESLGPQTEVQNLELEDRGSHAIERVLGYMSGTSLYVDTQGRVVVYDTRSSLGDLLANATRPGHRATGGSSLFVVRRPTRPSKVVSLFTVKAELKFEYEESSKLQSTTADEPVLINVCPIPDFDLEVGGRRLPRGSVVPFPDLFEAWRASPFKNARGYHLSNQAMCAAVTKDHGTTLEHWYAENPIGTPQPILLLRVRAAMDNWRRLFRIHPRWFNRIASFECNRVTIRNPETGEPAPSLVWSAWLRRAHGPAPLAPLSVNFLGAAGPKYEGSLSGDRIAPARFRKLDSTLSDLAGIIKIDLQEDPYSIFNWVLLGSSEGEIPQMNGLAQYNRTFLETFLMWTDLVLDPEYRMATVLTCTPNTPQNIDRFYHHEVNLGGDGPVLYSRILGIEDARFAWHDAFAERIKAAFQGLLSWDSLKPLLVNEARVKAVAEANAARIADLFRDRTFGGHRIPLDTTVTPKGCMADVAHGLADQELATDLYFPPDERELDIWRFMDQSSRQAILKVLRTWGP